MSPVPEKFQAYGEAVCAFLSHATRREKAAVRQELMDHLTDHTQALLDAGCPPEAVVHKEFYLLWTQSVSVVGHIFHYHFYASSFL